MLLSMEELEHARMYREQVVRNGSELTDFAVRDWFWEHIPRCDSPTQFVSLMGLGFEAGNLEHADRYARGLEAAGDAVGAGVCRRVASDEEAHVRFAARWFRQLEGEFNFDAWMASLPGPLSPSVLRGARLARDARGRAGFDGDFLDRLEGSGCVRPGS